MPRFRAQAWPEKTVALLDVMVEERKGLACGDERLHPERDLAELDGVGIDVDAVLAVLDDITNALRTPFLRCFWITRIGCRGRLAIRWAAAIRKWPLLARGPRPST